MWTLFFAAASACVAGCSPDSAVVREVSPGESLAAVRDEIRAARAAGDIRSVEVRLASGRYELSDALVLGPADSHVVWRAAPGAAVRITGARVLPVRESPPDAALMRRVPEEARVHVRAFSLAGVPASGDPAYDGDHDVQDRINKAYEQLEAVIGSVGMPPGDRGEMDIFADGKALRRARGPEGRLLKFDPPPGTARKFLGRASTTEPVIVSKDEYVRRWADEPAPYVCGNWSCDWVEQRQRVEKFDAASLTMRLSSPNMPWGYSADQWFYGFNLLCELDRPGEWYADEESGTLLVWPPDGTKTVEVSVAANLVVMRGATNVVWRSVAFRQSRNTAVKMKDCVGCTLEGCDVKGAGGYAAVIEDGKDCGVCGGELCDLGGGGVALIDGNRATLVPSGHYVEGATIHSIGRRLRMYRPAVWLVGVGQRACRNHIYDAPHSAIIFFGNDLLIEGNDIHHVCKEANDCGVLYTGRSGILRGNAIRGNFIHQILGFGGRYCRTVYLDDGYAAAEVSGNVFWQVPWAVFLGGAQDNVITNNVFVDCATPIFIDDRGAGWMRSHVDSRIAEYRKSGSHRGIRFKDGVYQARYPALRDFMDKDIHLPFGNVVERNVFWKGDGTFIKKAGAGAGEGEWWCKKSLGHTPPGMFAPTNNLVDVDPLFADCSGGDFTLSPDSPVWKIGFAPIKICGH